MKPALLSAPVHQVAEWSLTGRRVYDDPWSELTVSAEMTGPDGRRRTVPAFWAGENEWRVRVSSATPGEYRLRSICSDTHEEGLHGAEVNFRADPGGNVASPLFRHGPVGLSSDGTHFAHADGTPFFWLADTWWMLMSNRVSWPDGFKSLTADRVAQGFTAVQVVLGFPPDTTPFDGRESNEGGPPWEPGYARINPRHFDACDVRIAWLIRSGLMPVILGGWGYHLLKMGEERALAHWKYLVARYGAYPVVWCLAGEGAMPYYLSESKQADSERLREAWGRVAAEVRVFDPWKRLLTLHPRRASWDDTVAPEQLDFHMIQIGHMPPALKIGAETLDQARTRVPGKRVVNAEPPYEGHGGANGPDVQRYAFWSTMLNGGVGFTYGAAGVFQANDLERPTGDRPDGGAFDRTTWDEAVRFPGAKQIARGKALLSTLPFHRFEPHPEWAEVKLRWGAEGYHPPFRVFAAGVPGACRVIYVPVRWYHWDGPKVLALEPGVRYRARYVDPEHFNEVELGVAQGGTDGSWTASITPYMHDWLLILQRVRSEA